MSYYAADGGQPERALAAFRCPAAAAAAAAADTATTTTATAIATATATAATTVAATTTTDTDPLTPPPFLSSQVIAMSSDYDDRCKLKDAIFLALLEAVSNHQRGHDLPSSRAKQSTTATTITTSGSSSSYSSAAFHATAHTVGPFSTHTPSSACALSLEGALHDLCVQLQDTLEQVDVDKTLDILMDQVGTRGPVARSVGRSVGGSVGR